MLTEFMGQEGFKPGHGASRVQESSTLSPAQPPQAAGTPDDAPAPSYAAFFARILARCHMSGFVTPHRVERHVGGVSVECLDCAAERPASDGDLKLLRDELAHLLGAVCIDEAHRKHLREMREGQAG